MSYGLLIVYGILVLLSIVLFAVYKIKEYSIIDGITLIPVRIIIGLLMVIFLMIIIPKGSYYAINSFGDKVYYLYATDGKNDEDIFFSEKIYKSANIEDTFQNIAQEIKDIDEKKEIKDRDAIVKKYLEDKNSLTLANKLEIISRHKVVSSKYIKANKEYVDYLQTQERDIDDVFNYCDKISSINDNVYRASFYLSFIIFIIAILFLKNRVLMYFFALIIYVPIITNDFSKGLLGSFISNLEIVSNHFSNQDIQTISSIMSSTTKEAFVTVIILDGLFQAIVSKKQKVK